MSAFGRKKADLEADYRRALDEAVRKVSLSSMPTFTFQPSANLGDVLEKIAATPATLPEPKWEKSIGSLFGYRRFKVDQYGRIVPWHPLPFIWKPGENVAECLNSNTYDPWALLGGYGSSTTTRPSREKKNHRAPAVGCDCGFYARTVYDEAVFDETFNDRMGLLGAIEGYGRAEIGSKGFRCEKAVIREVWLPGRKQHLADRLAALYPDVTVHTTKASLLEAHPEFGMSEQLEDLPADFWTRP